MNMHSTNAWWNVVYTYPNAERKIVKLLEEANVRCFLPVQKVVRQWSDRKKSLEVPLFPNYVFVNINTLNQFKVLALPGVARYVSFGGRPVKVSDREIGLIQDLNATPGLAVEDKFSIGEQIVLSQGPFKGLRGMLLERKGKTRFGIRIDSINKILSIEVPVECVQKLCYSY